MRQKDRQVVAAETSKQTAQRRARIAVWTAVGAALLISLLSFATSVSTASRGTEEFLASARAETARGARADLDAANGLLLARGLPVYEQPRPDAPNYVIQRQAARAWARADYPEELAELIREDVRVGRRPAAEPAINDTAALPPRGGDSVVTVIPIGPLTGPATGTPTRTGSAPTGRNPAPAPAPGLAPAPAAPSPAAPASPPPAQQQRGLLPLLPDLPVRVPLLSE